MTTIDLSNVAKLVELSIGIPPSTKRDKKQSAELDVKNNSAANVHRIQVSIFDSAAYKEAKSIEGAARNANLKMTEEYSSGGRLVTNAMLIKYLGYMNDAEQKFYECRDTFLASYPDIVNAAKAYQGDSYNPKYYPPVDELKDKFRWTIEFSTVPQEGNFITKHANEQLAEIEADMEIKFKASQESKIQRIVANQSKRYSEMLSRLSENLQPDKKVYDSMIEGARELCDNMKSMNVTNDPNLEGIRKELERAMLGVDAVDIRADDTYRKDVKTKVDDILNKFNF